MLQNFLHPDFYIEKGTADTRLIRHFCAALLGVLLFAWSVMPQADQMEQAPHTANPAAFFLVASQQMADPRFRQTVLLVTKHGNASPIGVIVNRPEHLTLDKMFPEYPAAHQFSLFNGGPLYTRQLSYLVGGSDAVAGALMISSNVYLAYDQATLFELLEGKRTYKNLRVMHGMASWAPGQLEGEIRLGEWIAMPVDVAVLFDLPPAKIWQELHRRASSSHEI
jgi:putative transcriptional regulator